MNLIPSDRPYLEWRAEEAGSNMEALRPHADMLIPELENLERTSADPDTPSRPASTLNVYEGDNFPVQDRYPLSDSRIAFVGAGAGTIMLASYLSVRGAKAENMTVFDPSGSFGGKWQSPDVQFAGFNNPAPLDFGTSHRLRLSDRSGHYMLSYLQRIAQYYLAGDTDFVADSVTGINQQKAEESWLLETADGHESEADIVVLASGNSQPNKIDGKRFKSNLDKYPAHSEDGSFTVERNQRMLTEEELKASADGRPIVIIGLGNSMAAMIHQIQEYEYKTGRDLNYKILTDRSASAVADPYHGYDDKKAVFRSPRRDYLTGYSADIGRDLSSYFQAYDEKRFIPSVTDINYSDRSGKLVVKTADGKKFTTEKDPQVFALIGHQPDLRLFHQIGAVGLDHSLDEGFTATRKLIRPADGAVFSRERGYMSNIFAIGSVAATSSNRNSLVIPGINGQVPSSTLTMGVRSIAKQLSKAASVTAGEPGRRITITFPDSEIVHEDAPLSPAFAKSRQELPV
ncbi:MAG TPA: hypothetical protein VFK11_04380 [Candidatus Saccharimonadales bacterium]|nr:hypothetical protein [Candidatus Saccharimonadales bacterium]